MSALFDKYNMAASGMQVQRLRMGVISSNLANVNTTQTANGEGPYKRRDVVFQTLDFNQELNKKVYGVVDNEKPTTAKLNVGVKVSDIYVDEKDFIYKYQPNHPHANDKGYVAYPNINPVVETANMIEAQRAYEANANVYTNMKAIDLQLIDILKQ
jgi:flagellar basal-body rod protein FlgC